MSNNERRNKGEGSLQELIKGKKYKVVFTIGYDENNKQKRRSFTASTKKACLDKLNEWKQEAKGNAIITNNNLLFSSYLDHYLKVKEVTVKYSSYTAYQTYVNHLRASRLANMKLSKITTTDINDLIVEFNSNHNDSTTTQFRITLGSVFNLAISENLISTSPVQASIKPKKPTRKVHKRLPNEDELMSILQTAYGYFKVPTDAIYPLTYHAMLLAATTGMRIGEITGLRWSALDFNKGTISITETASSKVKKGDKISTPKTEDSIRFIAVDKQILNIIKNDLNYTEDKLNDCLFKATRKMKNNALHVRAGRISSAASTIFKEHGFDDLTFHDLRHTHATLLLKKAINVKVVSERLGHANIDTTLSIYSHVIPGMDEEAAAALGSNLVKR